MALFNSAAPEEGHSDKIAQIAAQNDAFRRVLGFAARIEGQSLKGKVLGTAGFRALPEIAQAALMREVVNFSAFDAENDPLGDHSFGVVEAHNCRLFWKIDLYDAEYSHGVTDLDATDLQAVRRVLTLYLPSEH